MTQLMRCTRCVIPETHESIVFDSEGVCNVCRQQEQKQDAVDWDARGKELEELVAQYRGKYDYDCLVPFSGGKDSTFTLWYLVKKLKLKPLVVQFDHGFMRPTLRKNNERTFKTLGVDVISFRPNWTVVKRLMLESLKRKGDFCWHCHTGIFAYPMQMAIRFQVPLIFWGEPSAEYTSYYDYDEIEEVDERRFNRFVNLGITADDMEGMIEVDDPRDLDPFRYPPLAELRKLKARSVCLGSFIPWDVKAQVKLIQEDLGWEGDRVEGVPEGYSYEKIECYMQGVRDYLKFIKRGYARSAHLASIDIRNGRIDRDTGLHMAEHDGMRPASLDLFLKYVGLTEEEFNEIAKSHAVAPWEADPNALPMADPLPDMDDWDKTA